MIENLEKLASSHGDRIKVIPMERLKELKVLIQEFKEKEELNGFQQWIVNDLYKFEPEDKSFPVNSILLVAIHHPFCAKVQFHTEGLTKTFLSLVKPDFEAVDAYLKEYLTKYNYLLVPAENLPLKRLGVHSGLAKYGRNNITYVEGLGSNISYSAYYSDLVCEDDTWGEAQIANTCAKCNLCIENCPTGAIRKERFLIDNQKCLSNMNEMPGEFPEWLPADIHHTLYDCLLCQRICPMNKQEVNQIVEGISFSEEETNMLLEGKPITSFSKDAQERIHYLGMNAWYNAIPRNLKVLLEQ